MILKTSSINFVRIAMALVALMYAGSAAQGAIISIAQANLTSASQVLNSGVYISGANLINDAGSGPTVNGVLFKPTQSGYSFEGPSTTPGKFRYVSGTGGPSGNFPGGGLGASLNELLDSTLFGNAVANVAIVGLDPTTPYRLQILMGDNRNFSSSQNWLIRSGTFTPNGGAGAYVSGATIGAFTVTSLGGAGTHVAEIITINFIGHTAIDIKANGGGQAFLNGMSLFSVVPEPSSVTMLSLLGAGLVFLRRRKMIAV